MLSLGPGNRHNPLPTNLVADRPVAVQAAGCTLMHAEVWRCRNSLQKAAFAECECQGTPPPPLKNVKQNLRATQSHTTACLATAVSCKQKGATVTQRNHNVRISFQGFGCSVLETNAFVFSLDERLLKAKIANVANDLKPRKIWRHSH